MLFVILLSLLDHTLEVFFRMDMDPIRAVHYTETAARKENRTNQLDQGWEFRI